jgi:hypothetical protein
MKRVWIVFVVALLLGGSALLFADAASDTDLVSKWQTQQQTNSTAYQSALKNYDTKMHDQEMLRLDQYCQDIQDRIDILLNTLANGQMSPTLWDRNLKEYDRLTTVLNARIKMLQTEANKTVNAN